MATHNKPEELSIPIPASGITTKLNAWIPLFVFIA